MSSPNDPIENDVTLSEERSFSQDGDDENESDNNIDEEDSSSNEDDSSSGESDDQMIESEKLDESQFQSKLNELEKLISENKYQYQLYVDIIKLTRDNGNLIKLREYREKMCELFPLSEGNVFYVKELKLNINKWLKYFIFTLVLLFE